MPSNYYLLTVTTPKFSVCGSVVMEYSSFSFSPIFTRSHTLVKGERLKQEQKTENWPPNTQMGMLMGKLFNYSPFYGWANNQLVY